MARRGPLDSPCQASRMQHALYLSPTVAIGTHPRQLWSRHFRRAALVGHVIDIG
jgi:hypothetical protein